MQRFRVCTCHKARHLGLMDFAKLLGSGPKSGERIVVIVDPTPFSGALLVVGCNLAQNVQSGCQFGLEATRDEDATRRRQAPSQLECHTSACAICSREEMLKGAQETPDQRCNGLGLFWRIRWVQDHKDLPCSNFVHLSPNACSALWA